MPIEYRQHVIKQMGFLRKIVYFIKTWSAEFIPQLEEVQKLKDLRSFMELMKSWNSKLKKSQLNQKKFPDDKVAEENVERYQKKLKQLEQIKANDEYYKQKFAEYGNDETINDALRKKEDEKFKTQRQLLERMIGIIELVKMEI